MNKFSLLQLTSAYSTVELQFMTSAVIIWDIIMLNLTICMIIHMNNSQQIARQIGNEIRMAVNDLIEYMEDKSRAASAKARELFNRRAAKYGLSK